MPLHYDSAPRCLSSFLSLYCIFLFCSDLALCAVRFICSFCRMGLVCYEPLWNARCLLTCSLSLHFQFENKFCVVGYDMKRKKWKAYGPKLLSGKSSLLRALLLGLWNVLRLKTISFWDLGHAAAVLSPCSCKNWLKQAEHNCVCNFAMGLLNAMQYHQAWCWGKRCVDSKNL